MPHMLTIVAYDIPSDGKRAKLYSLLRQYGSPVQKSVFEARLSHAERRQLMKRVSKMLDPEVDRLVMYVIPEYIEKKIESIGSPRPDTTVGDFYLV